MPFAGSLWHKLRPSLPILILFNPTPHLGQKFSGELCESPPNGWGPVENNSRAENSVKDVDYRVPDKSSGSAIVLLDLSEESVLEEQLELTCLVDEESLDGGEYEEDEGGDDPDLGRDKVLLSFLPPVTGSQGWYKVYFRL